jgi:tetratricopeptide (TPR) repeat protein
LNILSLSSWLFVFLTKADRNLAQQFFYIMQKLFSALLAAFLMLSVLNVVNAQKQNEFIRQAGELMSQGDLRGALAVLDKAIEKKKDLFEAYRMQASLRLFSQDIAGAIDSLNRAQEIKPNNAEIYYQRAEFRLFLRQNELALKDYDSAIVFGLKTEKVYAGRGGVKRDLGKFDEAIADYQTAIAIRPLFASAHIGLAITYKMQGNDDAEIAQLQGFADSYEDYKNGKFPKVKGEPLGASVTIKREGKEKNGSQIYLTGQQTRVDFKADTPEELEFRKDQMEQRMNVAAAYLNLALGYERRGDNDKALNSIEKSLGINPNDGAALGTRGKIRLNKGDVNGAMADFNVAVNSHHSPPTIYADRGIALLLQGKDAEAQKDFDKFLQAFPAGKENLEKRIVAAKEKRSLQTTPQ